MPNVTYTPTLNYSGTDSFTFRVSDGKVSPTTTAKVSITITPGKRPAGRQRAVRHRDGGHGEGDYAVRQRPRREDAEIHRGDDADAWHACPGTAPALTYHPAANYTGADSFTFKVNDGALDSTPATVSITVTPVNDAPVAQSGTLAVTPGVAAAGTLTGSDIDSATLTYTLGTAPAKGTVVITNATTGAYTYTPKAGATGTDTFTFRVSDGALTSAAATVTVTIAP